MRLTPFLLAALLLMLPLAASHKFNHEDRHEACGIYGDPNSHFVGDGHAHTHDPVAGAALPDHDPCKQTRMAYPGYESNAPLSEVLPPSVEIDPLQLLFSDGDPSNTEVFAGGEAYQLPVPEGTFRRQSNLAVVSDLQAAGMGFPGKGTYDDPYIVEGYAITGNMLFKDTSKCFVIRNNVIVSRVAVAPLLPDPQKIVHLPDLTPQFEALKAAAESLRARLLEQQAVWQAQEDAWAAEKAAWDTARAAKDATLAQYQSDAAAWQAAFDAYESDYVAFVRQVEAMAADFESYASGYGAPAQPERAYAGGIDASGQVADMAALQPAFEAYLEDQDGDRTGEDVEGWVLGSPPPESPPPGFWGDQADWDIERQNYEAYRDDVLYYLGQYRDALKASEPDAGAYADFLAEYAAFQAEYDQFVSEQAAFMAGYASFQADLSAFRAEFDSTWASTGRDIALAEAHFSKVAQWTYEYAGQLGTKLYNTARELLDWVVKTLFGIVDLLNPNNVAANTGQLILDWNGQCIHAYNNVANDLRVNQNNDRTGYATGGILEDNRFFTIGQIRHYDGIFRENEVGNRAFLHTLLNPSIVPAAASTRAINNDGANQGWYYGNTIYGQVDLDFHGHHHSAGFFAPTSHYHGSNVRVVQMYDASGRCTATWSDVDMGKHNGPHADYPQDDDVDLLGETLLERTTAGTPCLEHMDHSKRWTSVFFNDNLVIDPNGVGLRFEDRDHRNDDERANSENVLSLKAPHFHQKWVQLEDNTVVGKLFVDVLNAAGTDLWSDDWSKVLTPAGVDRTVEALAHPGAEIVTSHPYRNDAWLDIERNTVFATQPTGILVSDADDLTLLQLKDNRGFALPKNFQAGLTPAQFLQWLKDAAGRAPDDVAGDIRAWGGQDRGVQTLAALGNLRDAFTVEHCGNVARGLDKGLVATDRIYDDGASVIAACGPSDWGTADPAVSITYRQAPVAPPRCTEILREDLQDTDDFYATELVMDTADAAPASACEELFGPAAPVLDAAVATAKGLL